MIDWAALLALAMRAHGIWPRDFWDMTPFEVTLLLGGGPQRRAHAPGREEFAALAARFPDRQGDGQ